MKLNLTLHTLLFLALATHSMAQTATTEKHVNIGLTYPISTNGLNARRYANELSLNLLIALSNAETGFSCAGLANIIIDSSKGLQIAGLTNVTGIHSSGLQIAGLANLSGSNSGPQIAGLANIVVNNSSGVQISGLTNKAGNSGSQIAGLVNMAHKVKGIQLAGLLNIADSSDYPIALVNLISNGEKSFSLSTDETLTTLLSFRSGGRRLYGIIGAGYNHKGQRSLDAWEAGFGSHLVSSEQIRLNLEWVGVRLTNYTNGEWKKSSLRMLAAYKIGSHLQLFAGPSFNSFYTKKGMGEDILDHYLWSGQNSHSVYGIFFGATGGISYTL